MSDQICCFLWYPFNVKVGNVKESSIPRTVEVDGVFRLLQKSGEALIWGLDPSWPSGSQVGWDGIRGNDFSSWTLRTEKNWQCPKPLVFFYSLGLQVVMVVGFHPEDYGCYEQQCFGAVGISELARSFSSSYIYCAWFLWKCILGTDGSPHEAPALLRQDMAGLLSDSILITYI